MSDLDDIKRRAGISEQDEAHAQIQAAKDEAYKVIYAANQQLRAFDNVRGVKEAREHFGQGLDILARGGAWR